MFLLLGFFGIWTSKKSILDINNWFWMVAYGDISLVKIQLLIYQEFNCGYQKLNCWYKKNVIVDVIVDVRNVIVDINNSYPGNK